MHQYHPTRPSNRFTLDRQNKKIFGVCAGLARYLGVNTLWLRLFFVLGAVLGFGSLFVVYLAIALIAD